MRADFAWSEKVWLRGRGKRRPWSDALPKWRELRWQVVVTRDVLLGGASIGLQVGGSSTDLVLLLMNPKVVNQILTGKTKMGTDATAAAGPGATAASASDVDILTYGRAKGAFAGVSLGGATVEPDNDANHRLYGKTLTATGIVRGGEVKPEGEGQSLVAILDSKVK